MAKELTTNMSNEESHRSATLISRLLVSGREISVYTRKLMGPNYWPYGIEANQNELELVMRYTYEQGLAKLKLLIEEVFHPSTLELIES